MAPRGVLIYESASFGHLPDYYEVVGLTTGSGQRSATDRLTEGFLIVPSPAVKLRLGLPVT